MGGFLIYSIFFGELLFLFPIFVSVDGYLDAKENKCWFALNLYGFIRVFGGYLQCKKEGFVLHLSKKKALILPYGKMSDTRRRFEITKGFQLWRFHQIIETGGADSIYGVYLSGLIQTASATVYGILKTERPFVSFKNTILLTEQTNLKISVQTALVFNGLVLTVALVKKLLEVLLRWIRRKNWILLWKKRQNASQA